MLPGTTLFVASVGNPAYDNPMAKAHKFDLENPAPSLDDEDEETLAAIDEGTRDAEAGQVVPAEKARELLPKCTIHAPAPLRRVHRAASRRIDRNRRRRLRKGCQSSR
jgi:hypothetical protein